MSIALVPEVISKFSSVTWGWTVEQWETIANSLDLKIKEKVLQRTTYAFNQSVFVDMMATNGDVAFVEITLEAFLHPAGLSETDYQDKQDEYTRKFVDSVQMARAIIGEPAFYGEYDSPGFPEDQEAIMLAFWNIEGARLMIQQKHEDYELPIRICIVVAPPLS